MVPSSFLVLSACGLFSAPEEEEMKKREKKNNNPRMKGNVAEKKMEP